MNKIEPERIDRAKVVFRRTLLSCVVAERTNIQVLLGKHKTIRGDFAAVNALLFGFVTPFLMLPIASISAARSLYDSRPSRV